MPVRIYEIAKNLGIQSKDVLTKAKELNISNAKVASSSLDKITAEYLQEQLSKDLKPEETDANSNTEVAEEKPPVESTPSGPVLIVANKEEESEEALAEKEEPTEDTQPNKEQVETEPKPTEPAQDSGPKVGQQVGFIDLGNLPVRREPKRREKKNEQGKSPAGTKPSAQKPGNPSIPRFTAKPDAPTITLKPPIMVRELAEAINRKPFQLIADLMQLGVFANVNQAIDEPTAQQLCAKHGFKFEAKKRQRDASAPAPVQEKTLELDTDDE